MMQILHSMPIATALVTDPTWIFSIVLCIILLSPLLLSRLRIPHVIGLILAGVLVGKYGLNILDRDSSFELFGQVGIYYIMFLAGLELDMGSVQHYGKDGIKFGILTFLIPCLGPAVGYHQDNPHHRYTLWEHIVRTVENVPPDPVLRFTMLLHDAGKTRTHTTATAARPARVTRGVSVAAQHC